jgi:hypothetical protein
VRISLDWRLVRAFLGQHLYMLGVSKLEISRARMALLKSRLVSAWLATVVRLLLAGSLCHKHLDALEP